MNNPTTPAPTAASVAVPDAELSALVAEKVAGATVKRFVFEYDGDPINCEVWSNSPNGGPPPPYATSADAVCPLLEKARHGWDSSWTKGQAVSGDYMVRFDGHIGRANTFARAACLALLAAHAADGAAREERR